ncbi:protein phosphatase 2C domain-containing protein [Haloarcula amylovorans]|uniref:protein phosphatase 2C domain-containing protein n=1 Tax=Haloarcula amylovorans TaxID=2562280 RepID=UPI0010762520|nr:protein phosphatase 2C domain-containing protein [Halomicroarcula amylolytica]
METVDHLGDRLIGCSIRGSKHEAVDVPCRDAWNAAQLSDGKFVMAVADGVGSTSRSHEGANLATRETVAALERSLDTGGDAERETVESNIKDAVTTARSAIHARADELGEPPTELDTTLLVAVAWRGTVAGAAVGDGGIVYSLGASYGLLVPREESVVDLPYSNITVPLQHQEWDSSYRFGYITDCDGIALFSDGLSQFAWDGPEPTNATFFDTMFDIAREDDGDVASTELVALLQGEPYRDIADDKTIVISDVPPSQ